MIGRPLLALVLGVLPAISATIALADTPLLDNPGFEEGGSAPRSWFSTEPGFHRDGNYRSGSWAVSFTHSKTAAQTFYQIVPVVSGASYTFSGYCQKPRTGIQSVLLQIRWFGNPQAAGGPLLVSTGTAMTNTDEAYHQLTLGPVTAPAGAQSAKVEVATAVATAGVEATVYCDDFDLTATGLPSGTPTPISGVTQTPTPIPGATQTPTPTSISVTPTPETIAPTPVPVSAGGPPVIPTPQVLRQMRISEVLYRPDHPGREAPYQWVELENLSASPVPLGGWAVRNGSGQDTLPTATLNPYSLAIVAPSNLSVPSLPVGTLLLVVADATVGGGLLPEGDHLALVDPQGRVVDGLSWGTDSAYSSPSCPSVSAGHSLQRVLPGAGGPCAFEDNPEPSPGAANRLINPPPTPAPVSSPSPTPAAGAASLTPTATPTHTATPAPVPAGGGTSSSSGSAGGQNPSSNPTPAAYNGPLMDPPPPPPSTAFAPSIALGNGLRFSVPESAVTASGRSNITARVPTPDSKPGQTLASATTGLPSASAGVAQPGPPVDSASTFELPSWAPTGLIALGLGVAALLLRSAWEIWKYRKRVRRAQSRLPVPLSDPR